MTDLHRCFHAVTHITALPSGDRDKNVQVVEGHTMVTPQFVPLQRRKKMNRQLVARRRKTYRSQREYIRIGKLKTASHPPTTCRSQPTNHMAGRT